jgi:hypothetical protein
MATVPPAANLLAFEAVARRRSFAWPRPNCT